MDDVSADSEAHVVELMWAFEPADYFEEAPTLSRDGVTVTVDSGKVTAYIPSSVFDADPEVEGRLDVELRRRFAAEQLTVHKPFKLSGAGMARVYPDGRRSAYVRGATLGCSVAIVAGQVDVRVTDAQGNVVRDTKQERLDRKRALADLCVVHGGDPVMASIMQSRASAVSDPANELVHLYEVRDALSKRFQGQRNAETALGLPKRMWNRLGELCNHMPLRQGRHRGEHLGGLRDATQEELQEVRSIALAMAESYLHHLEAARCGAVSPA